MLLETNDANLWTTLSYLTDYGDKRPQTLICVHYMFDRVWKQRQNLVLKSLTMCPDQLKGSCTYKNNTYTCNSPNESIRMK